MLLGIECPNVLLAGRGCEAPAPHFGLPSANSIMHPDLWTQLHKSPSAMLAQRFALFVMCMCANC